MTAFTQLQTRLHAEPHTWLITGVAGFIGSNLLETLLKLNQRVVGLDNFAAAPCLIPLARKWERVGVMVGSTSNTFSTRPLVASEARQSMSPLSSPVNQVYNVAVGDRTTLNELYEQLQINVLPSYPHLMDVQPVYRDFRAGDVRLSLADISKAATLLGYQPTHHIGEGLKVVMDWYVQHLMQQGKA